MPLVIVTNYGRETFRSTHDKPNSQIKISNRFQALQDDTETNLDPEQNSELNSRLR